MKRLVRHLVQQHHATIAAKSLLNCHVKGLHSIMLVDAPEQRIRLFIATNEHELWQNSSRDLPTLAAHAHHCDITLEVVQGVLTNYRYTSGCSSAYALEAYRYTSGILHEQGGFKRERGEGSVLFNDVDVIEAGDSLTMAAHVVHSVRVEKGRPAAWFVYEGKEDELYNSLSYSNHNLEQTSFDGLYQPMTETDVIRLLHSVGLYD